jgi:hypothetical protein
MLTRTKNNEKRLISYEIRRFVVAEAGLQPWVMNKHRHLDAIQVLRCAGFRTIIKHPMAAIFALVIRL